MANSASDFVAGIHKIVDDRLREMTPYTGRITGIGPTGYTVLRGGDDVDSLEIPALEPAEFEIDDRVLVQPTPNGYAVILGKIKNAPSLRFHYTVGPWSRENITGIASFTMRLYMPSAITTWGSIASAHPVPAPGKCVGGIIHASEARTGGEAELGIEINGVDNVFSTIRIGSSPNQYDSNIVAYDQGFTVNTGDLIRAKVISNNWAPATADFSAWLFMVGNV